MTSDKGRMTNWWRINDKWMMKEEWQMIKENWQNGRMTNWWKINDEWWRKNDKRWRKIDKWWRIMNGEWWISKRMIHSLIHSFIHSFIPFLTYSFTPSLTHSLNHSFTHSLTHSLNHSLTHWINQSIIPEILNIKPESSCKTPFLITFPLFLILNYPSSIPHSFPKLPPNPLTHFNFYCVCSWIDVWDSPPYPVRHIQSTVESAMGERSLAGFPVLSVFVPMGIRVHYNISKIAIFGGP